MDKGRGRAGYPPQKGRCGNVIGWVIIWCVGAVGL